MAGPNFQGTAGAIVLAAFLLVLIGGVLGLVNGAQRVDDAPPGDNAMEAVVVIVSGVAALVSSFVIWQGRVEYGGIIAIICGVIFLVLGPETAGLLAVLGGVLALVARRIPEAAL